jgi:hypothetical protein
MPRGTANPRQNFIKPAQSRQPRDNKPDKMKRASSVPDLLDHGAKDHVILEYVANSVVGKDVVFQWPFGPRQGQNFVLVLFV